jgi:SAM-dependent methyltransferase
MTTWRSTAAEFSDPVGATRVALFAEILQGLPAGRLIDLGAGHGIFSRLAADLGFEVTAVDARAERFPADARIDWRVSDIRDIDLADYDVIACLGLWYHLTLDDQKALAAQASRRPLVIDTHIAVADPADHRAHAKRLTPIQAVDDHEGRLYFEGDLQDRPTASFGNDNSFWPTEHSLYSLLDAHGYDVVRSFYPPVLPDRRFFLATAWPDDERATRSSLVSRYVRPL